MKRSIAVPLFLLGCHSPVTEIVVVTDTDLAEAGSIDAIAYEIDASAIGAGEIVHRRAALAGPNAIELPAELVLVYEGGDLLGPIEVRAIGLLDEEERVRNAARVDFIPNRSVIVRLDLFGACAARSEPCPPGTTCAADGACTQNEAPDAGAPPDAGLSCGADCSCETDCTAGCSCVGGCNCDLECGEGDECRGALCSGGGTTCKVIAHGPSRLEHRCEAGAECRIEATEDATVDVHCAAGADCEVKCDHESICTVRCDEGASCSLECDDSSECSFATCSGEVTSCGGRTSTCNMACDGD